MQLVTREGDMLRILRGKQGFPASANRKTFSTGVEVFDALAPGGAFGYGVVHELLSDPKSPAPKFLALLLARSAGKKNGTIVWSDPAGELYPPALPAGGIDLRGLILLRYAKPADERWALAECLRCPGISATVACVQKLTRVEARRLQLAAEQGGGIGIFLRPFSPRSNLPYAAATRWLVRPVPGDEKFQRWSVELLHGHGGRIGQVVLLEVDRETRVVCASAAMVDRSLVTTPQRASA